MYSTNSCVEALTTNMTVLRDVAFRRWLSDRTSLVIQSVKKPPAMQEDWVQSLGWASRGSSRPKDQTHVSASPALTGGFFTAGDVNT